MCSKGRVLYTMNRCVTIVPFSAQLASVLKPDQEIPLMTMSVEEFAKKFPKLHLKYISTSSKAKDKANKVEPEGMRSIQH